MTAPLEGLKVVEVSVAMAAPYCGMMLADSGADVTAVLTAAASTVEPGWSVTRWATGVEPPTASTNVVAPALLTDKSKPPSTVLQNVTLPAPAFTVKFVPRAPVTAPVKLM